MKKKISILGSTGSIGSSTFSIINKKKKYFNIYLLAANKNMRLICSQIKKYKPNIFVVTDLKIFKKVKSKFHKSKTLILNKFNSIKPKKKLI